MTTEQVMALRGGELVQDECPEYPAIGVIVDVRVWFTESENKPELIKIQWLGGGCSEYTIDYYGWERLRVVNLSYKGQTGTIAPRTHNKTTL